VAWNPFDHVANTVSDVPEYGTVIDPPAGIEPEWPWSVVNVSVLSASELTISQTPGDWHETVL
jgi:hypothetical protein